MASDLPPAATVLDFWFAELQPEQWWVKDEALDQRIRNRFGGLHEQAARGELASWRRTANGRLAEVIVLDQLSRNLFRNSAQAFACDPMALVLAQEAIAHGALDALTPIESVFLCMPFMHSESRVIHEQAVVLFTRIGIQANLDFELRHKAIIDCFGRYPHRNELLGRVTTAEEVEFLRQPGSAF